MSAQDQYHHVIPSGSAHDLVRALTALTKAVTNWIEAEATK